jgi:hypothetical protein
MLAAWRASPASTLLGQHCPSRAIEAARTPEAHLTAKPLVKRFQGATAKAAEAAAHKWSTDLTEHAALTIESITAAKKGNKYIATVLYRE